MTELDTPKHRAMLQGRLLQMGLDHHTADDLTQDTLLAAVRAYPTFRHDAQLSSWLYRIATNMALNHIHQAAKRLQATGYPEALEDIEPLVPAHEPTPDEHLRLHQDLQTIAQLLAAMSPLRQACFRLHVLDGIPSRQVGLQLGITPGSVRGHVFHVRSLIRTALEDQP